MRVRYDLKAVMKVFGVGGPDYPPQDPSISWKNTPQITPVPTRQDIIAEREYGTPGPREGDEARRISGPRLLSARTTSAAMDEVAKTIPERDPDKRLTTTEADYLYAAKMLANVNATAALGFDEQKIVTTEHDEKTTLNISGMYSPRHDVIWSEIASGVSTPVHESIHRGIQKLKAAGSQEAKALSNYGEEMVVRAIMLRHFGNLEEAEGSNSKQLQEAAKLLKDPNFLEKIYAIDKQAAHLRAEELIQRHPLPIINFNDAKKAASGG